jgi:hypothetical protein
MVSAAIGAMLLLAALVPASTWLSMLRDPSAGIAPPIALGAQMFRASLAALGLYICAGARLGWWRTPTHGAVPLAAASPGASPTGRVELAIALTLTAVGALLRFYRLDEGLWNDEVVTLVEYVRPPLGEIVTTYTSQNQNFLYSILGHLSIASFGESAWALRLPAALFGIATLPALWRFGRLVAGPREALLATALLTFSYQHVWFSQNARGYSALLFWAVVSSHFLLVALRSGRGKSWAAYGVAAAFGMYTHLTMLFIVAGQFAVYAWYMWRAPDLALRDRLRPVLNGFVLTTLVAVAAYAFALPQMAGASAADRSDVATWRSPIWMISELARGLQSGPALPVAAVAGMAVLVAGIVSYWRRVPAVPILLIVPAVSGTAAMMLMRHHLWPRFYFFVAGFGVLLIVRGVVAAGEGLLRGWPRDRARTAATVMVVLLTVFLGRSVPYAYGPKQDYGGARDYVDHARATGDAVVIVGGASVSFRLYFAPAWTPVTTVAELDRVRADHPRTWVVYAMPIEVQSNYPDVYAAVQRDFALQRTFEGSLKGGTICVYRADRGASGRPDLRSGVKGS